MKNTKSLVVIGGGASAALLLVHLARHRNKSRLARVAVYDRESRFARGIAYSTTNPLHLLNVRANNMSAFPDDPQHLVRWLEEKNYTYRATDFIPRMIYARYLEELWNEALSDLRQAGVAVALKAEEYQKNDAPDITVIASGNAHPYAPAGAENLSVRDGYHANPWNIDYASVKGDVIIAGTGLSMVDTVMALQGAGFEGGITAVSRKGLLPAAHVSPASYSCFLGAPYPEKAYEILRQIRLHVRKAGEEAMPWQAVIDSLRPVTNEIWLSLTEAQRRKVRRLMPFWNIHRHRMAPEAARVIRQLMNEGKLVIVKDDIQRVEKGIKVHGRKKSYSADVLVNCLGYGPDKKFHYDPEKDFALGPALTGYYFETVAMPEIRAQAQALAERILGDAV